MNEYRVISSPVSSYSRSSCRTERRARRLNKMLRGETSGELPPPLSRESRWRGEGSRFPPEMELKLVANHRTKRQRSVREFPERYPPNVYSSVSFLPSGLPGSEFKRESFTGRRAGRPIYSGTV